MNSINDCNRINSLYFRAFTQKDLRTLASEVYSPNVILKDWIGEWVGRDSVLLHNKTFFENEFNLIIEDTRMELNDNSNLVTAINNIVIEIGGEVISVVDEITFEPTTSQITNITAYKR